MTKLEQMKALVKELNKASEVYYNSGKTIMSDREFDQKLEKLKQLENETLTILNNSPTHNVGSIVVSELNKVTHTHPMLSLDKCHTVEEIKKFANGKEILAMFKLDGLTVSAEYNAGILTKLETRGDGIEGNDILIHAESFKNLPFTINYSGRYVIDGEAIITYDDFETINSKLSDEYKYANPRNLASGSLNLLDTSVSKKRQLKFIAWDIIEGNDSNNLNERLDNAAELGFDVVPYYNIDIDNKVITCTLDSIREMAKQINYPIDGVVLKFNDIEYGKSLGRTEKFFRNGIAYKYEDDRHPTKLLNIEWTMGKSGALTPTIITEPIEIDGTMVERASVHNVSIFKQLHFTKGCTCYLYKANMIIPQCDCTDDDGIDEIEIPTVCPICGFSTEIRKDNESEMLYCNNDGCKGKLIGKLNHFVSKKSLDIDGLSEATLELLLDKGYVTNFVDLFHLDTHRTALEVIPGFGKKSVDKLLSSIEKSRKTSLERFLCSLSVPLLGKTASKLISRYCHGDIGYFNACLNNDFNFAIIEGVGQKLNQNIYDWFNNEDNFLMYAALQDELEFPDDVEVKSKIETNENNNKIDLNGKAFCITGKLIHYANRDAFVLAVESHNGKVASGVTSKTDYLVTNDTTSGSSKNKKAAELGIHIITEEEFIKMIGD